MATILVVDDDALLRKAYTKILTVRGYTTLEAEDGEQAIEIIRGQHIDGMILDVMMPKVTGFDVLSAMQMEQQIFPVVVVTNLTSPDVCQEALKLGAKSCLTKEQHTPVEIVKSIQEAVSL